MSAPVFVAPPHRWPVATPDSRKVSRLQQDCGISSVLARVLVNRGIETPEEADRFLNPSLDHLHDPRLLPDYAPAVKAILGAREAKQTIYIHGDYDADGVTSTALFTRFLNKIGCNIVPHVPHRMTEGYGIHMDAVGWAKAHGTSLFLTCDCGGSAIEQMEAVHEAGMSAVVTDHHQLGDKLPRAQAVVNPHRKDSDYPFAYMSGVGVALKLCAGIAQELGLPVDKFYRAYLDIAVIGTVADVMPLVGENRIITAFGLPLLQDTKKIGLRALIEVCGLTDSPQSFTPATIGFKLAPRINAVGRIGDPSIALELLLTEDGSRAREIAQALEVMNIQRREEQDRMFLEAVEMVEAQGLHKKKILLVAKEGWHTGIVGIVAGKLREKYTRPSFVGGIADGQVKGSGRSIPEFHLADAIKASELPTLTGGGHAMAAGFGVAVGEFAAFSAELNRLADETLSEDMLVPTYAADLELEPGELGLAEVEELEKLAPFGNFNPRPVMVARGLMMRSAAMLGKTSGARLNLQHGASEATAIYWLHGEEMLGLAMGTMMDVAFSPELNRFRGQVDVQWRLLDYRLAGA